MTSLNIDFARSRRSHPAIAWWLLAIGMAGTALALGDVLQAQAQWREADQALRQQADRPGARPVVPGPAIAPQAARASGAARAALARPWGPLMRTLEAHTPASVALLSLEASGSAAGAGAGSGALRLIGEARDVADAVAYVEALRAAAPIRAAELTHHETREGDGVALLRFSIDVVWGGSAP
ncbi:MAG: PilN domain-containing protein [Hydrogenophaga sp.]|jgi:hypothetical protein